MRKVMTEYDVHREYTINELIEMFKKKGLDIAEAKKRAEIIKKEMHRLNVNEVNSWERIRRLEERGEFNSSPS